MSVRACVHACVRACVRVCVCVCVCVCVPYTVVFDGFYVIIIICLFPYTVSFDDFYVFNIISSFSVRHSYLAGRVVPDGVVTLETDEGGRHVLDASGTVYRNIDLERDAGQLDSQGALTLCLRHNFDDLRDSITHTRVITLQVHHSHGVVVINLIIIIIIIIMIG